MNQLLEQLVKAGRDLPKLVPQVRILLERLGTCLRQDQPVSQIKGNVTDCDLAMMSVTSGFKNLIKGYDYDDSEKIFIEVIYGDFDKIKKLISSMFANIKNEAAEDFAKDLLDYIDCLHRIEKNLDQFNAIRRSKPKESKSEEADSIIKACRAIMEKRRDWSILEYWLKKVRPTIKKLSAEEDLSEEGQIYCEALENLIFICEEKNLDFLPEYFALYKKASDKYFNKESKSEKEEIAYNTVFCPVCSQQLELFCKKCPQCGTIIPESAFIKDTSEEDEEKKVDESTPAFVPRSVRGIIDSLSKICDGEDYWSALSNDLATLIAEEERWRKDIASLPAEAWQDNSSQEVEEGFDNLDEAISTLYGLASEEDLSWEIIEEITDKMIDGIGRINKLLNLG
ncbi:hypothetical protein IJT10_08840 [bacterium]|nr:hypothetical protein [bacterium]